MPFPSISDIAIFSPLHCNLEQKALQTHYSDKAIFQCYLYVDFKCSLPLFFLHRNITRRLPFDQSVLHFLGNANVITLFLWVILHNSIPTTQHKTRQLNVNVFIKTFRVSSVRRLQEMAVMTEVYVLELCFAIRRLFRATRFVKRELHLESTVLISRTSG